MSIAESMVPGGMKVEGGERAGGVLSVLFRCLKYKRSLNLRMNLCKLILVLKGLYSAVGTKERPLESTSRCD